MPELPEVQTVVLELNKKLKNRKVKEVRVFAPKLVSVGFGILSPKRKIKSGQVIKFKSLLKNLKIVSVKRRAKLIIINLTPTLSSLGEGKKMRTSFSLLVHLKMTGQFIFEDKKLRVKTGGRYRLLNKLNAPLTKLPSKHTHVVFYFTDSSVLYFNDIRKFGYLKLVHDTEINKVKEFSEYGPEPLEKTFTFEKYINQVKKRPNGKVKQVLMDNKVVVGIGNIYSDEILFHAKVRPTRVIKTLSDIELKAVYNAIRPVLQKGIQAKGSSVGDFVRTDGSWGKMGKYHFVYGRKGQKCKKCGSIIESLKIGGRTGSFCPGCQR